MILSLLHLVGLRPQVYYTLTNFKGGVDKAPWPTLNTPMSKHSVNKARTLKWMRLLKSKVATIESQTEHRAGYIFLM